MKIIKKLFITNLLVVSTCGAALTPENLDNVEYAAEFKKNEVIMPTQHLDEQRAGRIDNYFTKKNKWGRFNGVVLYADGDEIFQKAYGYADIRAKDSLSTESVFQLASVSKPITATAVLMLAQEGKLDLKAKVTDFFPEFPYPGVTVDNLLTHRSGLANYMYFADHIWQDKDLQLHNEDVLDMLNEEQPARYYPPNRKYHYCNTNYALLANIVAEVSGMSFGEFMSERIFEPLRMQNSFIYNPTAYAEEEHITLGHDERRRKLPINFLDGVVGDKGMFSSAGDLLKFDMALREGKLLNDEWLKRAYTNHNTRRKPYGYGWRIKGEEEETLIYHNGWWRGYRTYFLRMPEKEQTIVVLTNQLGANLSNKTLLSLMEKEQ